MPTNEDQSTVQSTLEFQEVSKSFGELVVLDSMDLDVARQEKLVIIGPSGSGKTTVLRLMMTLELPSNGRILIDGELYGCAWRDDRAIEDNRQNLRRIRRKVGMVFQQFNLFPHMNVLANIMEAPLRTLNMPKEEARERAIDLLRRVNMESKIDSYPGQLSGGQQQRVAVARALALRPQIMLFDEVTSALDPELCGEVLGVIRRLGSEHNLTMLMVTHQMGFAREFADCVCFFHQGRIHEQGTPEELFGNPQQERTQAFLSAVNEAH